MRTLASAHCLLITALVLLAVSYGVSMTACNLARYHDGGGDLDLGIVAQILWNSRHGAILQTSIYSTRGSILQEHWNPLYLPLAALYWWQEDVRLLIVLQSFVIGSAIIPLGFYAARRLGPAGGMLVTAAFAMHPVTHYVHYADFHPVTLSLPLFFSALALHAAGRTRLRNLVLVIALCTDEAVAATLFVIGIVLFWRQRCRSGLRLSLASACILCVYYGIIAPLAGGNAPSLTAPGYFAYLTVDNGVSRLAAAFSQPQLLSQQFFSAHTLIYLRDLAVATALLPLLAPAWLAPLLPQLLFNVLSGFPGTASLHMHYNAIILAVAFPAAIAGIHRIAGICRGALVPAAFFLLSAALLMHTYDSPLPFLATRRYYPDGFADPARFALVRPLIRIIPADASVTTSMRYWAYLAHRRELYTCEYEWHDSAYVLIDFTGRNLPAARRQELQELIRMRVAAGSYAVLHDRDGILLLKRVATA